jgi:hypothetical protein
MAEKKKSSPKRAEARAASRRRGEKRHEANRAANEERALVNRLNLEGLTGTPMLTGIQTTYGPTTARYGKRKRPSKIRRAVARANDPRVALRRAEHLHKS